VKIAFKVPGFPAYRQASYGKSDGLKVDNSDGIARNIKLGDLQSKTNARQVDFSRGYAQLLIFGIFVG
jgi:hypothetical protein